MNARGWVIIMMRNEQIGRKYENSEGSGILGYSETNLPIGKCRRIKRKMYNN